MKKYRVLVIVRHPAGGIRTFCRYVYRNFPQERYHFTLIAPELSETHVLLDDLKELDLAYISVNKSVDNWELLKVIVKVAGTQRFDLIHSHGFTAGVCSVVGAISKQIPHILTCHDVFTEQQFVGVKGFIQKTVLGSMLSLIDDIQCVSHDAADNLLAYLPILKLLKHKVIAIPNGIETEAFLRAERRDLRAELGLPQDTFLIGFLGRFMSQKGFRYLLDALEVIKKKKTLPKNPLILAFSGHDGFIREEKEDVKKRGFSDSVLFLPFVPHVASTLKGLDVVAMPSLWEACGLLAMETMVAGVPLVGTNCIGLREVLHDTPAYVVPARNSLALAETLMQEMRTPTRCKAEQFATEAVRRFQVKESAAEIEKLMRKCLER